MACRPSADGNSPSPEWQCSELRVKRPDRIDVTLRNTDQPGNFQEHLFRQIPDCILYRLQDLNELTPPTLVRRKNLGYDIFVCHLFPKSSRTQGLFLLRFLSKLKLVHIPRQIPQRLHLSVSAYTLLSFDEILIAPAGQLTTQKGDAQNL